MAEDMTGLFHLSLDDLMAMEVDIASNQKATLRQQPGTVTLLSSSYIEQSGARYLSDLLRQVPGFWVGTDTIGTFSVSFRGIWGMEAKILLSIDGVEQNELAFGSLVLGNRYPVANIRSVEIIRGPGSARYGGQAALAVIRVTTKGQQGEGGEVHLSTDLGKGGNHHGLLALSYANNLPVGNDSLHFGMSASIGQGDYSDKHWQALDGYRFSLKDNSNAKPVNLNMNLQYQGWRAILQYDRFEQQDRLLFGDSGLFFSPNLRYTRANELSFEHLAVSLDKKWQANDRLSWEAAVSHVSQRPWNSRGQYGHNLRRELSRTRADISALYQFSEFSSLLLGGSAYRETARVTESYLFDAASRFGGHADSDNTNLAVFAQYQQDLGWAVLTLAGRYEDDDAVGDKFVPRLALTRHWQKWHAKLVYNEAFKSPQFDTLASAANAGNAIYKTESTRAWELEAGYQVDQNLALTTNLFWMKVSDYIGFDPQTASNTTLGDIATYGVETQAQWQSEHIALTLSHSYFRLGHNNITDIGVDRDEDAVLGIPEQMFKLNLSYFINRQSSFNLSAQQVAGRYACAEDSNFICGQPKKMNPESLVDVFYQYNPGRWSLSVGVNNLLDEEQYWLQPYRGGQSPIRGQGRRVMLDISYRF
ncbi:ligand-gated channel [Lacimicrobium alkaliphilum]|uniref:Ligand-gated channel n=2 Tax=Lacimicrobium alkaliphilum TaxID=1526571 RepID=A0ABQ1R976_9ALTE|nr:ligand-gated channel [Lacimicrobium alkaliphilum]